MSRHPAFIASKRGIWSYGYWSQTFHLCAFCVTAIKSDPQFSPHWLLLTFEKVYSVLKNVCYHPTGFRNVTIACEHSAPLIWANVAGVVVTNTGSLIWAGMLIRALYICRQIINISLVAWPAHVALQLWTAAPFIILMPWWSTGGQDGSGKSWYRVSFQDKNTYFNKSFESVCNFQQTEMILQKSLQQ